MTDEMDRPFPPGPRGPEENVPGAELWLTPQQVRALVELVEGCDSIKIEDRGSSYIRVTPIDKDGKELGRQVLTWHGDPPKKSPDW